MKQLLPIALLLFTSCGALRDIPADGGLRQQLMEFATAAGDAAIRLKGTELLVKHAPELLPLIDKSGDRQISLGELIDFLDRADAAQVVMLGAIYFR